LLSNNAFLGSVSIGENQEGLEVRADRQGFVESAAFSELKAFSRLAIDWSMIWRDHAVRFRDRQKVEKTKHELEALTNQKIVSPTPGKEALGIIKKSIQRAKESGKGITKEDVGELEVATKLVGQDYSKLLDDLHRFQLVASTATLTLLFSHEVKHLMIPLRSLEQKLKRQASKLPEELGKTVKATSLEISNSLESLKALLTLTEDMGVLDRSANPVPVDLVDAITAACDRFQRVLERYGIETDYSQIPEGTQVGPILPGELQAILLNLISNSVKAVLAGGDKKPIIEFATTYEKKKVLLVVSDNGIGLPESQRDDVFAPLVSDPDSLLYEKLEKRLTKEDHDLLGVGSGLGLSIIRSFIENYDGYIAFKEPVGGWKTQLTIQFPTP